MADPKIITSPLSGPFTEGDTTVDVQFYRREDGKGTLEVIDGEGRILAERSGGRPCRRYIRSAGFAELKRETGARPNSSVAR